VIDEMAASTNGRRFARSTSVTGRHDGRPWRLQWANKRLPHCNKGGKKMKRNRRRPRPRQTPAQVKVSLNNYDRLEKDARRVFREALLANPRSVEPALAKPDITCERLALEKVIGKVETEAARRSHNSPEEAKRREEASRQSLPNLLRQGVIDEMSYRLFADGSIEVDMTHGTVRFQSIEELRQHLAKKGLLG
jgi:hypothetical protein